jgi:hypothetical protein
MNLRQRSTRRVRIRLSHARYCGLRSRTFDSVWVLRLRQPGDRSSGSYHLVSGQVWFSCDCGGLDRAATASKCEHIKR